MNVIKIFNQFPTQKSCVNHLEKVRWNGNPKCVYCSRNTISRHIQKNQQSRWQCSRCKKSFSVTVGTIFHRTHLPLQKWFLAIALMVDAKKSLSAKQLQRHLGVQYKTAWHLAHRIRKAMEDEDGPQLTGASSNPTKPSSAVAMTSGVNAGGGTSPLFTG